VPGVMRMPGGLLDGEVGVVAEGGAHEAIMLGQVSEVGQRQVTAVYRGQFVSVDHVERDPRGASRARLLFPVSDGDDDVLSRTGGSLLARGEGQVLDADVGELRDISSQTLLWRADERASALGPAAVVGGTEVSLLSALPRPLPGRTGLFHAVRGGGDLAVEDVDRLVVRRAVTRLDGSDVEVISAGRTMALVVLPLRLWRARAGRRLTDAGRCAWVDVSDLGELVMFSRTSFDGTRAPVAVGDYCSWQGLPFRVDASQADVPAGRTRLSVDAPSLPEGMLWTASPEGSASLIVPTDELTGRATARTTARLDGIDVEVVSLRRVWVPKDTVRIVCGSSLAEAPSVRTDGGRVVVEPDGRSSAVVDFSALTAVSVVSRP
jgi:hypothetical protein